MTDSRQKDGSSSDDEFNGGEGDICVPLEITTRSRAESECGFIKPRTSVEILKLDQKKIEKRRSKRLENTPRHKKQKELFPRSLASIIEKDGKEFEPVVHSFGNYKIGTYIGKGSFGKVFKGLNVVNGQFVALKEIPLTSEILKTDELPKILQEIKLMKELNHENIVKYIDYKMIEERSLFIILEYIENGSLKEIINKFGNLPEKLTANYCYQILNGINYLHNLNIIHRDIKAANILITKDSVCKLADFGVAVKLSNSTSPPTSISSPLSSNSAAGTIYWMAPEIFEMKEATAASDVWSFGCTVLELLTGSPPYKELRKEQAICKILESESPPDYPSNLSKELVQFLNCCFQKEPSKRSSVKQLLNHPWILTNLSFSLHTISPARSVSNEPSCHSKDFHSSDDFLSTDHEPPYILPPAPFFSSEPSLPSSFKSHQHSLAPSDHVESIFEILKNYNIKSKISFDTERRDQGNLFTLSNSQEILQKLLRNNKLKIWKNPNELSSDELKTAFSENQEENLLLLKVGQVINQTLSDQLSSTNVALKRAIIAHEKSDKRIKFNAKKIGLLEEAYASAHSDFRLAKLIFGSPLSIERFVNGIRGVLLLKRAKLGTPANAKSGTLTTRKWKKKWLLLQDNFLFCYSNSFEDITQEPSLVIRLLNFKILPIAERDIGKKYCFQLTTNRLSYYFAAANPQVLLKWLNVLAETVPWHQSDAEFSAPGNEQSLMEEEHSNISTSDSVMSLSDYSTEKSSNTFDTM